MKKSAYKTETSIWRESLIEAISDLQEGRVDGFRSFLHDYAPDLTYREIISVRDKLITGVRHKTDYILCGAALKAHATRVSSLFEELQDIIFVKRHYYMIHKREMYEAKNAKEPKCQRSKISKAQRFKTQRFKKQGGGGVVRTHLRLAPKPFREISGERQSHVIRGVEVDLIVGNTKKDVRVFQIVRMSGKLPKINVGSVYSIGSLPLALEEKLYPEKAAERKTKKAEQIAIKLEANKLKKKNKGNKKAHKAKKAA